MAPYCVCRVTCLSQVQGGWGEGVAGHERGVYGKFTWKGCCGEFTQNGVMVNSHGRVLW